MITLLNIFGVRVVALINNTGVLFELLGLFVFAIILALFNNNQGVDVVFDTGGAAFNAANFLVAMFMGLFVIYGFDTASTLAEETNDPRRAAPRAVLGSIGAAFVDRLRVPVGDADGRPGRPGRRSSPRAGSPRRRSSRRTCRRRSRRATCSSSSFAIFVCCLAIQASTIRLAYSMSRDRQLPGSKLFSTVHPSTGTPAARASWSR